MFNLRSSFDQKEFQVSQNVVNASTLLKNICELTKIKDEPIVVECSSECLNIYIKLIDHYHELTDSHDEKFENSLFKEFDDKTFVKIINEASVLDSDFFFDAVADFFLCQIKKMDWEEIKEYLEIEEDDFTWEERQLFETHKLEYLLSIDFNGIKFPFPETFKLSLINKSLKNENDRHPIKLREFIATANRWIILIPTKRYELTLDKYNKKYFDALKNRKIIVNYKPELRYSSSTVPDEYAVMCSSMNFFIPKNHNYAAQISFSKNNDHIYYFDICKCPFPSIIYDLYEIPLIFDEFYKQLVAPDLSKKLVVYAIRNFNFFNGDSQLYIHKKQNASKFHKVYVSACYTDKKKPTQAFKDFLLKYMEKDGHIRNNQDLFNIPKTYDDFNGFYHVKDVIDYLNQNIASS